MGRSLAAVTLLLVAASIGGCVTPSIDRSSEGVILPASEAGQRPTVVLLIDTGVLPYHDAFRIRPGALGSLALLPYASATAVRLDQNGSAPERVDHDKPMRASLHAGQLALVEGTRLGVVRFNPNPDVTLIDYPGHGTMTSYAALSSAPDVIVVMAQVDFHMCDPPLDCWVSNTSARALRWAAEQPWVDVISMSFGGLAGEPYPQAKYPEMREFHTALDLAAKNGKILVTAPTNTPPPNLADWVSGPPQAITVGGVESRAKTWSALSATFPDTVSNYTIYGPYSGSVTEMRYNWGTSFAAPVVAGTLGEAIHILRSQGVPYDATKLRRALNASAIQWAPTEYDPTKSPSNDTMQIVYSPPAPHLVPGAQMGWGYVDGSLAPEIARRVAENDYAPKADVPTQQAMSAYQAAREAYWKNGGLS